MSTDREQKLEAALRELLGAIARKELVNVRNVLAALATPPTSEWNEAITEVIALVASGKGDDQALLRQRIRALKRKEET